MKILAPLAATGLLLSATAGFAQMTPGSDPSTSTTPGAPGSAVPGTPGSTMPGTPGNPTPGMPGPTVPTPGPTDPSTVPPTNPADPTAGAGIPAPPSTMDGATTTDQRTDAKKKKDRAEQR